MFSLRRAKYKHTLFWMISIIVLSTVSWNNSAWSQLPIESNSSQSKPTFTNTSVLLISKQFKAGIVRADAAAK